MVELNLTKWQKLYFTPFVNKEAFLSRRIGMENSLNFIMYGFKTEGQSSRTMMCWISLVCRIHIWKMMLKKLYYVILKVLSLNFSPNNYFQLLLLYIHLLWHRGCLLLAEGEPSLLASWYGHYGNSDLWS